MTATQRFASPVLLALTALGGWAPAPAAAQSSTGELTDEPAEHRVAGELGFFYRSEGAGDVALFQPSLYGNFTLVHPSEETFIQLDVAWRFIGLAGDTSAFRAMNPFFGARFGADGGTATDGAWRARGGLGFTLPLTNLYDDFAGGGLGGFSSGALAQLVAPGMQGEYDAWLLTPLNASVVLRGDFEYRAPYFVVGGDGALAFLFPVEYRGRTADTLVDFQLGVFAGARPIRELTIGLRFQAVALITTGDTLGSNTEGFTSLIPFVRGELGQAFVEGRLLMNLDTPWGFSFETGMLTRIWAVQVSGGARF